MDQSATFARHFSRLVWLLLHEPASVNEQKAALRALVTISKEGEVTLATRQMRLLANDTLVPEALNGVPDLAAQLIGHSVQALEVDRAAAAADLLGAARILAGEPVPGDDGRAIAGKLAALEAKTVRLRVGAGVGVGLDLEMEMLSEEESSTAAAAPHAAAPPPTTTMGAAGSDVMEGEMLAFAAPRAPRESLTELLADLDAAQSPNAAARLLDEVVELTDAAVRDGQPLTVADAYAALVSREVTAGDGPLKRPYQMALRRLTKPTVLRVVAQMLVQRPAREAEYFAALTRAGDDGAEALIEQLTNASSLSDRRIYFNALVRLNTGVPALLHMLGDARWYVVRNAADLLGELQVAAAEGPLSELFRHDDERVRRAAAAALGKLGTPRASQLLHQALRDASPQVRTQAVVGITAGKGKNAAAILGEALETEADGEVQLSILGALGRLASPDAVQRLIKLAEPEGRLFKKKPVTHRVAAVQALGEARTPLAINALSNLLTDKEKEVRDAAVRAIRTSAANKGAE
jgi:hypothetical protein